ncbi:MAG: hypothetical protein M1162_04835 [Candidatus Thermoplasmatota archaeon]|nr:hypothetical protein [Candidatus Thermoplasmatota archaeon]
MVPPGTRRKMILLLMIMTPGIPEYLTGSSPITYLVTDQFKFFFGLLTNLGLYSTGALLIREFAVRYRKGWPSILALGCAYGIMEEGISVHTFFQLGGNPVNLLGIYGRYMGVNWVWALGLTFFHAIFSIGLPILFLRIAYPQHSREPLLGRGSAKVVGLFYGTTVLILNLVLLGISRLTPERPMPTALDYLFFGLLSLLLVWIAWKLPSNLFEPRGKGSTGRKRFFLAGDLVFTIYIIYAYLPAKPDGSGRIPFLLDMILFVASYFLLLCVILRNLPTHNNDRELFSLALGLLTPLLVWAEIVELAGLAPFITVVTLISIAFISRLRKMVNNRAFSTDIQSLV